MRARRWPCSAASRRRSRLQHMRREKFDRQLGRHEKSRLVPLRDCGPVGGRACSQPRQRCKTLGAGTSASCRARGDGKSGPATHGMGMLATSSIRLRDAAGGDADGLAGPNARDASTSISRWPSIFRNAPPEEGFVSTTTARPHPALFRRGDTVYRRSQRHRTSARLFSDREDFGTRACTDFIIGLSLGRPWSRRSSHHSAIEATAEMPIRRPSCLRAFDPALPGVSHGQSGSIDAARAGRWDRTLRRQYYLPRTGRFVERCPQIGSTSIKPDDPPTPGSSTRPAPLRPASHVRSITARSRLTTRWRAWNLHRDFPAMRIEGCAAWVPTLITSGDAKDFERKCAACGSRVEFEAVPRILPLGPAVRSPARTGAPPVNRDGGPMASVRQARPFEDAIGTALRIGRMIYSGHGSRRRRSRALRCPPRGSSIRAQI